MEIFISLQSKFEIFIRQHSAACKKTLVSCTYRKNELENNENLKNVLSLYLSYYRTFISKNIPWARKLELWEEPPQKGVNMDILILLNELIQEIATRSTFLLAYDSSEN